MSIKIVIIYNAEYQINQTHCKQKSVEALHITKVSKYEIKLKVKICSCEVNDSTVNCPIQLSGSDS